MIKNRLDAITLAIEIMNICHESRDCENCILCGIEKGNCILSDAVEATIDRGEGNKQTWDSIYREYNKASREQLNKSMENIFKLENNTRLEDIKGCIEADFAKGKDTAEKPILYSPKESVKHPNHYVKGGMECLSAIRAAVSNLKGFEAYCVGNIIKYIWRHKDKNGAEDLAKAMQYLVFLTDEVEK